VAGLPRLPVFAAAAGDFLFDLGDETAGLAQDGADLALAG